MEVGGDSTPCSHTSKEDKVGVSSLVWPSIATRALLSSEVKVTSAILVAFSWRAQLPKERMNGSTPCSTDRAYVRVRSTAGQ